MRTAPQVIGLPGCKSASQRALVLASLATDEGRVQGLSGCRDSADLLAALGALGVESRWEGSPGTEEAVLCLRGEVPQRLRASSAEAIPVGEGASTLRFLMAVAGAGSTPRRFRLAPALAARPHVELVELLRELGAEISQGQDAAGAWIEVRGAGGFGERRVEVGALRSSQTLSALWMAAGDGAVTWSLAGAIGSRGYLDLTAEMMRQARGSRVLLEQNAGCLWEQAAGFGERVRFRVMADPSAAVFFAVACILLRRSVHVARPWTSRHADATLLRALRTEDWLTWLPGEHGVELMPGPSARTRELQVDLDASPDSGPALAVLAAHLPHGGRFTGLARLRIKESDRVLAMTRLAEACGAEVLVSEDSLQIRPRPGGARPGHPAPPRARVLVTDGDHRTAMAVGIAALLQPGLEPDDPACVAKSFPHFWEMLACLRG